MLNLKALVVILALGIAGFALARPVCLRFTDAATFARRRNVWLALTVVAFVSPGFWMYAVFAILLLLWASSRDENPLALYALVTFTIPNASFQIPSVLVNQLFDLTQYRILSFAILIPFVMKTIGRPSTPGQNRLKAADLLLIALVVLQLVLFAPYESVTNTMRRAFLFGIDSVVVLYAFGRLVDRTKIAEVLASFWLACIVMAPVALFEWARQWLLYTGLVETWGDVNAFAWLMRGDSLRAQAATGHSINLGYVMALGLIFFMYLRSRAQSAFLNSLLVAFLLGGLFVSGSRGAWLTAAIGLLAFALLRPGAPRYLVKTVGTGLLAIGLMYFTPLKESVLDRLPFIGTADQGTVEYRQALAETSWTLIQQHLFFGDPFVYLRMEALRQGQGIIDIVNGYIFTALFAGLVGLTLQVLVYAVPLLGGLRMLYRSQTLDDDARLLGTALAAALLASLFYVATAGYSPTMYLIAGLLVSYVALAGTQSSRKDSLVFMHAGRRPRPAAAP